MIGFKGTIGDRRAVAFIAMCVSLCEYSTNIREEYIHQLCHSINKHDKRTTIIFHSNMMGAIGRRVHDYELRDRTVTIVPHVIAAQDRTVALVS